MMASRRFLAAVVLVSVFLAGCAGNMRVKIDPSNPVYQPKNEFERDYGFLIMTDERKVGYTVEMFPNLSEPIRPFDKIDTLDEFLKFEKHFWYIRDTDPNTPQNERKELIDGRLKDIQNEIFSGDIDTPGIRFDRNGGLKGDLARVYLLWGAPPKGNKFKLPENTYHVEMVVWYYLDYEGRVLMSFLFYKKYSRLTVFRNQEGAALDIRFALEEISRTKPLSDEELQTFWYNLEREDPQWIFRSALVRFSDYDRLDKDTRWTIDKALEPPEPAALTARRFKPTILGQPDIPEEIELIENKYDSFLPAYFRPIAEKNNHTSLMITLLRKNVDWEKQEDEQMPYATSFYLRISLQNKKTRKLTEFVTFPKFELSQAEFDRRDDKGDLIGVIAILPVIYPYYDGEKFGPKFGEILELLEPGEYIVNVDLRHSTTKKYNSRREEITVK